MDEEFDENSPEMIAFSLIASAGNSRSEAYEALDAAKHGDFDRADKLMKESDEASLEAHNVQTKLLAKEASGEHTEVNVMLVHAQDHLMTGILAKELITEIIELYKVVDGLKATIEELQK